MNLSGSRNLPVQGTEDEWELDEEVDAELALYEDLWDIEVPGLNLVRELLLLEIEVDELIEEYNTLNRYH